MAEGTQVGTAYVEVTTKLDPGAKEKIRRQLPDESDGGRSGQGLAKGMKAGLAAGAVALGNVISDVVTNAASTLSDTFVQAFNGYAEYEQLAGGVEKIFDQADIKKIMADANEAYAELNMSANDYLASINQTGAAFAQTMGDQKGYDTARTGMKAIADYASGTGRNLDELNDKYAMITRATSSYQSIADQFSGILPATSADFLAQAQAAGFLSDSYQKLTEVPVAEYQEAVTNMLQKGVADMGLAENTFNESMGTVSGSIAMAQAAWENWLSALGREDVDMYAMTDKLVESLEAAATNAIPVIGRMVENMGYALVTYGPILFDNALVAMSQIAAAAPDATPQVIAGILSMVVQGAMALLQGAPRFLTGAIQMLGGVIQGIVYSIPGILSMIANMVPILVQQVAAGAGQMLGGAIQFFDGITKALVEVGGKLVEMVGYIITHLPEIIVNGAGAMAEAGKSFLDGLVSGFLGGAPELDGAAAEQARQMSDTAAANADGSAVAQSYNDSLMESFDMSQFEAMATTDTQAAIDAAALSADAAPISDYLSTTAADGIDMSAMDPNATTMVENAVKAAQSVDSSTVGEQFSERAAGGIDTQAMADKIASATAAASTNVKVGVQVDTSGIQKLTSMAAGVASAYASAAARASASVRQISTAAASSGAGFSSMSTKAVGSLQQIATKAAQAAAAINKIPSSKTFSFKFETPHIPVPHWSMSGSFNPKTGSTPTVSEWWGAEGGILTKATIFGAGEAGPEAVLPLDRLSKLLDASNQKYGGDVVVNLNYDASADAESMARDIARSLKRYRMAGAF